MSQEILAVEESEVVKEYRSIKSKIMADQLKAQDALGVDQRELISENNQLKLKVDKLEAQLQMTRKQLEYQRKTAKDQVDQQINSARMTSELETFFLECIE